MLGGVPASVPCAGCATMAKVSVSPSGSLPVSVIGSAVSSSVITCLLSATGAPLTLVTVMWTVFELLSEGVPLSVAVKLTSYGPACAALGFQLNAPVAGLNSAPFGQLDEENVIVWPA